nr:RuBisCO long chain, Form III-c [uncultured bacterium]
MNNYLRLNYKPDYKNDIIAVFYGESKLSLSELAIKVAEESSIGTWTKITTLSPKTFEKLAGRIFYVNSKTGVFKIAYPLALFEPKNIPQLLSSIGGNVFSMKAVENLRLEDIEFPQKYINGFPGPKWGIAGIRKMLGVYNRPLVGCIMKPKVGLNSEQNAKLAAEVFTNGVDIIKDDENLTDLSFNRFEDRVIKVLKFKKQVEKQTKEKKVYVFNVTAPVEIMLKRAEFVKKMGGHCVMIDIVSAGWAAVQSLRNRNLGLIIHGHRAGHSTFTKNKKHGISMLVLANLARLAGIDQLHTGTVVGKMEGSEKEVLGINELLKEDWEGFNKLRENWSGLKSVFPIASGGLHPGLTSKLVKILGQDVIINFGGGIHGHPQGSAAGARAARQAVEATIKKIPLKVYAQKHQELKQALDYWKV